MLELGSKIKWRTQSGERTGTVVDHFHSDYHLVGYYVSPDDRRGQGRGYPLLVSLSDVVER